MTPAEECHICLGEHEPELHAATVRLRKWLRAEVARRCAAPAQAKPRTDRPNGVKIARKRKETL